MSPSRLKKITPLPGAFWDVAMEQLVFWRRSGTCPHDCMAMLGRASAGVRPAWDAVFHALLVETARMQELHVGPRRRAI